MKDDGKELNDIISKNFEVHIQVRRVLLQNKAGFYKHLHAACIYIYIYTEERSVNKDVELNSFFVIGIRANAAVKQKIIMILKILCNTATE